MVQTQGTRSLSYEGGRVNPLPLLRKLTHAAYHRIDHDGTRDTTDAARHGATVLTRVGVI